MNKKLLAGCSIFFRLQAAGIHLLICILVAIVAAWLVMGVWYPFPFREISGGRELFTLIVVVDVVIGPLITFSIYAPQKPRGELRRDLLIIALLQLSALVYGLHTVYVARPVYVVFAVDRYQVFRAMDIPEERLAQASELVRPMPIWGPRVVAAIPSSDPLQRNKAIEVALASGVDLGILPERWVPYEQAKEGVRFHAKSLSALRAQEAVHTGEIDALVQKSKLPMERLGYLPFVARQAGWVAVVDLDSTNLVDYLPFGGF